MVGSRGVGGPLQLFLFGGGACTDRRQGPSGARYEKEGLSADEQPLFRAVDRQRHHAEEDARRACDRAHAGRTHRALSRSGSNRLYFASITVTLTMRSGWRILSTTSMPEMTLPNTVYWPLRRGVGASVT